jgi:hypothetical protein
MWPLGERQSDSRRPPVTGVAMELIGSASDDVIRTLKINEPRRRYMTRRWLPTQLFTTVG